MHAKLDRVGLIIGHAGSPNGQLNVCQRMRVPWNKWRHLASGQNTHQRTIRPISSFSGGTAEKRAVYLPLEGVMTVIAKGCPFHVCQETKIKIVAVFPHFGIHNGETERSRHRKKNHDALFSVVTTTMGPVTNKHNGTNTIALTLSFH